MKSCCPREECQEIWEPKEMVGKNYVECLFEAPCETCKKYKTKKHFDHAKKIVKSWPKWKREIQIGISPSNFNVDGIPYRKENK